MLFISIEGEKGSVSKSISKSQTVLACPHACVFLVERRGKRGIKEDSCPPNGFVLVIIRHTHRRHRRQCSIVSTFPNLDHDDTDGTEDHGTEDHGTEGTNDGLASSRLGSGGGGGGGSGRRSTGDSAGDLAKNGVAQCGISKNIVVEC